MSHHQADVRTPDGAAAPDQSGGACDQLTGTVHAILDDGATVDPEQRERLQRCLADAPEAEQASLTHAYVRATEAGDLPEVAEALLHDKRDLVRDAASHALVELGPVAFPALRALLEDEDREVRWYATEALASEQRDDSIPLLVDRLADDDFSIRWVASNGLLKVGSGVIVPVLQGLVEREPSHLFHSAARRVLSRVSASVVLHEQLRELVESLSRPTTVYESQGLALVLLKRLRGDHRS